MTLGVCVPIGHGSQRRMSGGDLRVLLLHLTLSRTLSGVPLYRYVLYGSQLPPRPNGPLRVDVRPGTYSRSTINRRRLSICGRGTETKLNSTGRVSRDWTIFRLQLTTTTSSSSGRVVLQRHCDSFSVVTTRGTEYGH